MQLMKAALTCVIVLVAGPAKAETIFSNFGPGDTYSTNFTFDITSPPQNFNTDQDAAMGFTIAGTGNYTLTSIELAVINPLNNVGGGNVLDVFLMTDNAGVPHALIEGYQLTLSAPLFTGVVSASSILNPTLVAGTHYWVVASAAQSTSYLGWFFDHEGFFSGNGPTLIRYDEGDWHETTIGQAAFRISGDALSSPVPEPSTIALLLVGGVGLVGYRWRRKQQLAA